MLRLVNLLLFLSLLLAGYMGHALISAGVSIDSLTPEQTHIDIESLLEDKDYRKLKLAASLSVEYFNDEIKKHNSTQKKNLLEKRQAILQLLEQLPEVDKFKNNINLEEALKHDNYSAGILTVYYNPIVQGCISPDKKAGCVAPVYGSPANLVSAHTRDFQKQINEPVELAVLRGVIKNRRMYPYYTRSQIVDGAIKNYAKILCYLNPVDLFLIQIEGTALVKLNQGKTMNLQYHSDNGHHYQSIAGLLPENIRLHRKDLINLFENSPEKKQILNENPRYVFFKKTEAAPGGSLQKPLIPGRSIAVDNSIYPPGTAFIIRTVDSEHFLNNRIVFAHDSGNAIKGKNRADLYLGSIPVEYQPPIKEKIFLLPVSVQTE